jgi:hypothetical protein
MRSGVLNIPILATAYCHLIVDPTGSARSASSDQGSGSRDDSGGKSETQMSDTQQNHTEHHQLIEGEVQERIDYLIGYASTPHPLFCEWAIGGPPRFRIGSQFVPSN